MVWKGVPREAGVSQPGAFERIGERAVNWLRTYLPRLAEVVGPLRALLEEHVGGLQPDQAIRVELAEEIWKHEQVATRLTFSNPRRAFRRCQNLRCSDSRI